MNHARRARHATRLSKLRSLSPGEYALVLAALALLPLVNVMLRIGGFQRTRRIVRYLSPKAVSTPPPDADGRVERAVRCVSIAARRGPYRATCLRQSLALLWLLRWRRVDANLVIGVDKSEGRFSSHAWVNVGGVAVKGGQAMADQYLPVLVDDGAA